MTAALAIVEGGDVLVGIDSCTSCGGGVGLDNLEKDLVVFNVAGSDLILAVAGLQSIQSELAHGWKPPAPAGAGPLDYLRACAVSLRGHFTAEPLWTMMKDEDGRSLDGDFIAAWRGVAVEIAGDFGVVQPRSGLVAIGSGRDIVLGALAATKGRPAHERALMALGAAAEYRQDVARPFTMRWGGD